MKIHQKLSLFHYTIAKDFFFYKIALLFLNKFHISSFINVSLNNLNTATLTVWSCYKITVYKMSSKVDVKKCFLA